MRAWSATAQAIIDWAWKSRSSALRAARNDFHAPRQDDHDRLQQQADPEWHVPRQAVAQPVHEETGDPLTNTGRTPG
jgi:hypothetical protein